MVPSSKKIILATLIGSRKKHILILCLVTVLSLCYLCFFGYSVKAAVTCDGTHVHSSDFQGKHIPCTGEVWRSSTDYNKIYIKGYWSTNCAVAFQNIEDTYNRCTEWEWHYSNTPSSYTWYMNWSGNADYDSGEKHIDLHSTWTSYAAGDMTYLLAYVRTSANIIGAGFVSQRHFDPWGKFCYDQRLCIYGAYYDSNGNYVDAPGNWYDDRTNGDRH